jgi:hypothetical protein
VRIGFASVGQSVFENMLMTSRVVLIREPQSQRSLLKEAALENIALMSVTLDTSQVDRSLLKEVAPLNMKSMFVTLDTSQVDRSPSKEAAPVFVALAIGIFHAKDSAVSVAL